MKPAVIAIVGFACFCCILSSAGTAFFYIRTKDYGLESEEEDLLASLPEVKGLEARIVRFSKTDASDLGIQEIQVLDKMSRNMIKDGMVNMSTKTKGFVEVDLGKVKQIEKVTIINKKPPNPGVAGASLTFYKEKGGKAVKKSKSISSGDAEIWEYDWLVNKWRSGPKVGGFEKYGYDKNGVKPQENKEGSPSPSTEDK